MMDPTHEAAAMGAAKPAAGPGRGRAIAALAILLASSVAAAAQAPSSAQSCQQLWYQRNSLYKAHGYCFRTADAIRTFGNEGCTVVSENAISFSPEERALLNRIIVAERVRACR